MARWYNVSDALPGVELGDVTCTVVDPGYYNFIASAANASFAAFGSSATGHVCSRKFTGCYRLAKPSELYTRPVDQHYDYSDSERSGSFRSHGHGSDDEIQWKRRQPGLHHRFQRSSHAHVLVYERRSDWNIPGTGNSEIWFALRNGE